MKVYPAVLMMTGLSVLMIMLHCVQDKNPSASVLKVPELITSTVSLITSSSAQCGGTVTSDGGSAVTARGVCWSTVQAPTYTDNRTEDGTGTGSYISSMTGLMPNTTYYVRAYATNDVGTGYAGVVSFKTIELETGIVTDIDGNIYQTVKIGNRWWMTENLKVTRYRNGDDVPIEPGISEWSSLTAGACCAYDNAQCNVAVYGYLYNWYAVNDSRQIAPEGWHVPSDAEWKTMEEQLGMGQTEMDTVGWRGIDEGGKLKETGTAHWESPNTGATNTSGFTALPHGYRSGNGGFNTLGQGAPYHSSTEKDDGHHWFRMLRYEKSEIYRDGTMKQVGYAVRCVQDDTPIP